MRKLFLILIFIAFAITPVIAQKYNDCISISTNTICPGEEIERNSNSIKYRYVTNRNFEDFLQSHTYSYERRIYRRVWIGASFSQWKNSMEVYELIPIDPVSDGKLWSRHSYKMGDILCIYKEPLTKSKRNIINLGLGITHVWGMNEYVDHVYENPEPPYDGQLFVNYKNEQFTGVAAKAGYDFYFLWNRMNLGVEFTCRWYSGLPFEDFDCGFHIGFNF